MMLYTAFAAFALKWISEVFHILASYVASFFSFDFKTIFTFTFCRLKRSSGHTTKPKVKSAKRSTLLVRDELSVASVEYLYLYV